MKDMNPFEEPLPENRAALEVKEDGQIWLIPDAPTDPRDMIPAEEFSPYVSSYAAPYLKQYEKELASAERYLVGNQEVAISVLETHFKSKGMRLLKLIQGIYPIPGLKWEAKNDCELWCSDCKAFDWSTCKERLTAVISLPEPDKEQRKKLLIEMMQEDEKNGMYEVPSKTDNELIAEFMGEEISSVSANFGESIRVFVLPRKPISERKTGRPVEAKYDTSWDWLMPVVEKISRIRCAPLSDVDYSTYHPRTFGMLDTEGKPMVRIHAHGVFTGDTLIQAAYDAVVDFVKLYNQQSK